MRKSTLFISVVLTTFMLAVLYGVVSAYQSVIKSNELAAAQADSSVQNVSQQMAVPPTQEIPTQVPNLAPEAAAALASETLGRTDLYSVELSQFEGVDAYLVTFSSGDIVYVGLDGQILSISKLPVTTVVAQTRGGGGGGGNNNASSEGEHEGEHEDEHEDEHEGGDD
jgi:hypothetical protein